MSEMKRFTENPLLKKFRKEQRHETQTTTRTTTTTTEYQKFSSSHREEFSSSSEQHEEQQFFGENGKPKELHFTQSLQDAFAPNSPLHDHDYQQQQRLSKEFPPLQREPRHYQPRNIREEQKVFSEQFDDDKIIQCHQQNLFELREQFNTVNGGRQCQPRDDGQAVHATQQHQQQPKRDEQQQLQQQQHHFRTMAMKRTTERQQQFVERRWQHSSLPPLERLRLMQQQQQQTPHELVLDRFPPQLVQSVHQLTDAAERRHVRSSNSRGFSPFPVFGPFLANSRSGSTVTMAASMTMPQRQQSMPPQPTYDASAKRTTMAQPSEEMSMSMTTSQYKQMPIYDHSPQHLSSNLPAPMASSSGDEWQSAYEFLPYSSKQKVPMTAPKTAPKPQQNLSTTSNVSTFSSVSSPFDESIQCAVILCKFNAFSRQLAAKCTWPMADSQSEMFQSVASAEGLQKMGPILNESTTFSEGQANDEVRNLLMAAPEGGAVSPLAQMHNTSPEAQMHQTVKVEFQGTVNFLNATNLNVTNNRDIYNSLTESQENNGKNGRQMDDNRRDQRDKITRDKITVSPPVERYIESVCDLGPIFAEIGQTLRAQNQPNFVLTPTGNIRKVERQQQQKKKSEAMQKSGEGAEKNVTYVYRIGTIHQQQNTTKRRKTPIGHDNVPYLVHSSSQCNFARVSEISQEWRLARVQPEESAECAATVTIWRQTNGTIEALFSACCNSSHKKSNDRHQNVSMRRTSVDTFVCSSSTASLYQNAIDHATVSPRMKYQSKYCYGTMPSYTSMHRTQSADRSTMEMTPQWWRRHDEAEDALRSALTDVQREQAAARAYSKRFQCAEAERIESAILAISEGLRRPMEPVSKAQAEVKEELLRVRLAQLILNLDPDNNNNNNYNSTINDQFKCATDYSRTLAKKRVFCDNAGGSHEYKEALRAPIALLREKLRLLEHRLVHEDADCIGTELRRISATPPLLRSEEQRRRHETLSVRSGEIARMTPLIGMLQHKLSTLDNACTRNEYAEQDQHQRQLNHRGEAEEERKDSRSTPYAERKTVHELLKRMSSEIETIHELCRRDEVRDRLDAVLAVLKRVAASVDQITATLDGMSRSDRQQRRNVWGEEEQRKRVIVEQRERNSALFEERHQHTAAAAEKDEEAGTRFSPSKLEQAIKHRQEEALSRTEHKQRTEQLMKEMVEIFKEQQKEKCQNRQKWPMATTTNNGTMLGQPGRLLSTNHQWVHAVELSANFVRHPSAVALHVQAMVLANGAEQNCAEIAHPARLQQCTIDLHAARPKNGDELGGNSVSAQKGTGGKDRAYDRMKKRRFDQQTPRIMHQPDMPYILQYDEEDDHISAFKFGVCPPSYLPRDEMSKRATQHPFQYQLEVPSRTLQQQQQKYLQVYQQQYYLW